MRSSLKISDFKKITHAIEFVDFARINYLVGINGSGKSSVLSAISVLDPILPGPNIRFVTQYTNISLSLEDRNHTFYPIERATGSRAEELSRERLFIQRFDLSLEDSDSLTISGFPYNEETMDEAAFKFINASSELLSMSEFKAERVLDGENPFSKNSGKLIFRQESRNIDLSFISSGLKAFNKLRWSIFKTIDNLNQLVEEGRNTADAIFVIIEEPENNQHPEIQKKIPQLLQEIVDGLVESIKNKLFFIISTHSPFVISNSKSFPDQKVYLMGDGELLNLEGAKIEESSGYSGSKCIGVAAKMLGGDITDFGFPENFCLLEESSLQKILEKAESLTLIKNYKFISASGATRLVKLDDTVHEIQNLNLLLKCNPLYVDNYLVIMDNYQTFDSANRDKINSIRTKLGSRFTELSRHGLEDYYENLSQEIYTEVVAELAITKKQDKGNVKNKYALLIAELIHTQEDFSRLFGGELDFLLL